MSIIKFLPYILIVTSVLVIFDIYFQIAWTRYVRYMCWKPVFYLITRIISATTLIFALLSILTKQHLLFGGTGDYYIQTIFAIWFLPKIILTPILIFKDLIKIPGWLYNKASKKKGRLLVRDYTPEISRTSVRRREILRTASWTLASIPFLAMVHGAIYTTNRPKIFKIKIPLKELPVQFRDLKIVQISDIHAGSLISPDFFSQTALLISLMKPDIIFITGDFVNFSPDELYLILPGLKHLNAKYGIFGCLGNHDHFMSDESHGFLLEKLRSCGIKLLINENITLDIEGFPLQIASIDNTGFKQLFGDFGKAMKCLSDNNTTILLCHDPTNWDKEVRNKLPVDLMLSGHTHGGQIGLNFCGRAISPVNFVYEQYAGLYSDGCQFLYVNRGLGTVGPRIRVGIPPEITVFGFIQEENMV